MSPRFPEHCRTRYIVRVRFGETDLMGIVHHAAYLMYCEAGRVEYLRRRGVEYLDWVARGIHLPVVEARLRYRRTARFDERLAVETCLSKLTRVTVEFSYRISNEDGDVVVAEGHTLLACVGDDHVPQRVPADVAELLVGPETHARDADRV